MGVVGAMTRGLVLSVMVSAACSSGSLTEREGARADRDDSSPSTASAAFPCDVPLPEHGELIYSCFGGHNFPPCPETHDPLAASLMGTALDRACTNTDGCWCYAEKTDECSCVKRVTEVPCGPDPEPVEACCYHALVVTELSCG